MTLALILSAALLSPVPPTVAADPQPVIMNIESAVPEALVAKADPACPDADRLYFVPVEPICSAACNSARVYCCVDPNESCNYTCAMEYIRCMTDCRLNN